MAGNRIHVTLGTATPGGGFPLFGEAFASTIHDMDAGLRVSCRATLGSAQNIPLLEAGALDLALVQGEAVHEALAGVGRAPADLRIFWAMYSQPGLFCVRGDVAARTIGELSGRRIAFGVRTSGLVLLAKYVLDGLGLDMNRDFDAVYLDKAGDGAVLLREGAVDALWGAGAGWPGFIEGMRLRGARFIAPGGEEAARILSRHGFLKRVVLPAGSYEGQDEAIASVGSWSFILARPALDEALAYRLARALHRGASLLASRLPPARETTLANTAAAAPRGGLIHPGVVRLLREQGLAA